MRLKHLPLLLCLFCLPGLGYAGEKTVYGLNEYAQLSGIDLE
ncbi:MAG: ATP-dependent zinc protease, partial [Pseudomonas sp.]